MILLRTIWQYTRPYRLWILLTIFLQLVTAAAALWIPTLNAKIIDVGIATGNTQLVWHYGLQMLATCLLQIIAAVGAAYSAARTAMSVGADLRDDIYHKVLDLSSPQVHQFGAGTLITRSTNDIQQLQSMVLYGLKILVIVPLTAIGGIVLALRQDLQFSWVIMISCCLVFCTLLFFFIKLVPLFGQMQERIDAINEILREQIMGIRVVRAFVRENLETNRYQETNQKITDISVKIGNYFVLLFPVLSSLTGLAITAVLYFGAFRVASGDIAVGALTAFMQYLGEIIGAALMGTFVLMMVPRAVVCAKRFSQVMSTPVQVVFPEQASPLATYPCSDSPTPNISLEFRNVTHRFSGAELPVLSEVTFQIKPGTTTAIIGSTGAGKSTILNLILRSFDPCSGEIYLNGQPLTNFSRSQLAQEVGAVPQKPYLFSGTVASNLRFAQPDATDEELWQALEIAQAADFVRKMPEQLASPIAQGGTNVSGGQRQRLAIARLLVAKPRLYLLDDSFSALDMATDAQLRAALKQHLKNSSLIVVAQRVSSIMDAEQILVLDDGKIVGRGTHLELLATNAVYQEIVQSQLTVGGAQ